MELHLIRHGQTNWNEERRAQGQSDSHLTTIGKQQATELGHRIRHLNFDKVFCSTSLRTRQTADRVFIDSNFQIEYLDSLREIFLGPWEGRLYDDIETKDPDSYRHFWEEPHLFKLKGAESFYDLQERALRAVHSIHDDFHTKRIAVVSHGALIKTLMCDAENKPLEELWSPPRMHNCAHSIVNYGEGKIGQIKQYADLPFDLARRRN